MPLPYFALGFDQHMIDKNRQKVAVRMGDLQLVERLCRYGRPLYVTFHHQQQLLTFKPGGNRTYLTVKSTRWSEPPPGS